MMRIEHKDIIPEDDVSSYFPKSIKEMFGLEHLFFFGEHNHGTDEDSYGKGKFSGKYLLLLHRPDITNIDVSFKDSDKRWIRYEHDRFTESKRSYPQLSGSYPLLALRLITEFMRIDRPVIYMDFIRYADHEMFRKRGIATAVFDSVTDRLRKDGIKYLYTCAWCNLPSKSHWLERDEVPKEVIREISDLFYDKPENKVFQWSDCYLRILT